MIVRPIGLIDRPLLNTHNRPARHHHHTPGNHTGCLVIDVAGWTNAAEHLKKDDVVLSIDGTSCVVLWLPCLSQTEDHPIT